MVYQPTVLSILPKCSFTRGANSVPECVEETIQDFSKNIATHVLHNILVGYTQDMISCGVYNVPKNCVAHSRQLSTHVLSTWPIQLFISFYYKAPCPDLSPVTENTDHRGKDLFTTDLLFDWFGFDQTSKTVVHSTCVTPLTLTNKFRNRRSRAVSRAVSRPYFVSVTRCKFH